MVGKVYEGICDCWSSSWSVVRVTESDIEGSGDDSLASLRIL